MHVGGICVFDGAVGRDTVVRRLRERIHLIPRYTMRLEQAPLGLAQPGWVEDESFDVDRHVRHAAVAAPGKDAELCELAGQILSQPLDRDRPLWQITTVEGLAGGRSALVAKMHHALVDGLAAVDVSTVILDPTPEGLDIPPPEPRAPAESHGSARLDSLTPDRLRPARSATPPGARSCGTNCGPALVRAPGTQRRRSGRRACPGTAPGSSHSSERSDRARAPGCAGPLPARRREGRSQGHGCDGERRAAGHCCADAHRVPRRRRSRPRRGAGAGVGAHRGGERRGRQPDLHRVRGPAAARRTARAAEGDQRGHHGREGLGPGASRSVDRGRHRARAAGGLITCGAGDERGTDVQPGGLERARPAADLLPGRDAAARGVSRPCR